MLKAINFKNFKALEDYSLSIRGFNILTGPNNNGKSTILDAFRILEGAYRFASRYNPNYVKLPDGTIVFGFQIPESSIPINLENIQTNLNDWHSTIKYRFDGDRFLTIQFTPEHPIFFYIESPSKLPTTSTAFRNEFQLKIGIVPPLGQLEVNEEIVGVDYLKRWTGSRRSSRLFRNYWFQNRDRFDAFAAMIAESWPGMTIMRPTKKDMFSKELVMFCKENRIDREVSWAGSGFQIWLQLITHLMNSNECDLIVVDEPEIYLHPDLQHKVLGILRDLNACIILATHSVEIINSAEPHEVVLVDKKLKSGQRITDINGLQRVSNLLGSGQNLQITRLARGKKILFVEGADGKLLIKLARILGLDDALKADNLTIVPIEGFSRQDRILGTNWAFNKILGEEIKIAALLDRDYRTPNEIEAHKALLAKEISFVHIFLKKELENYLLIPAAIERAINLRFADRVKSGTLSTIPKVDLNAILHQLTDQFKSDVLGQLIGRKAKEISRTDFSTTLSEEYSNFENGWVSLDYRLNVISGKLFLTRLNEYLITTHKISITTTQMINAMSDNQLDQDLRNLFVGLAKFVALA